MARRLDLQNTLSSMAAKAWYQAPPSNKMVYPCFVYKAIEPKVLRADNHGYAFIQGYEVLFISKEETDDIIRTMTEQFEYCSVGRKYVSDNLYHYVFTIYY